MYSDFYKNLVDSMRKEIHREKQNDEFPVFVKISSVTFKNITKEYGAEGDGRWIHWKLFGLNYKIDNDLKKPYEIVYEKIVVIPTKVSV